MPAPSTPTNFWAQTGNGQNYCSWDITSAATSYKLYRSLDGVTFALLTTVTGTPLYNYYLDTSVTIGTQYYYQVAASNGSGDSASTTAQSVIPTNQGELCLAQLRLYAQQRADRVNSSFVTLPEWNAYINQSLYELYDLLIAAYGEDYFMVDPAQFQTVGAQVSYTLPDGSTSFTNGLTGAASYIAQPFYKLRGIDLGLNNGPNGWVTLQPYEFAERNQFFYPNTNSTMYGVFNLKYRLVGNKLQFIPAPSANQPVRIWYLPRMTQLLKDTDITNSGINGWTEYVITDAAIKALQKEESDVSVLAAQKMLLTKRLEAMSQNRDAGSPGRISNTRDVSGYGGFGNGGPMGVGGWY